MKRYISYVLLALVVVSMVSNDASAQTNRKQQKNNFSTLGKRNATIRHGITLQAAVNLSARKTQMDIVPTFGAGYVATQYYGVGNRYMQQSVTYQIGFGTKDSYTVHNVIGTFHCSYIGSWDMSPFIYGAALQFAFATKGKAQSEQYGSYTQVHDKYANFYIRPEIGLFFPCGYKTKAKEVSRVSFNITYGFNIKTYWNWDGVIKSAVNRGDMTEEEAGESMYPWTAMCHHVVTMRLNFNIGNYREMKK